MRRAKALMNNKSKSKPVQQYDLTGIFIASYPSQFEAMRQTGISNKNISQVCNGEKHTAGGYVWRCG